MFKTTPACRLMKGQRVRIEGPGTVISIQFDYAGKTVDVYWRPDSQRKVIVTPIAREHQVEHAE